MPKVIKKRIKKNTETNEAVINSYEKLKEDINKNKKNIIIASILILIVISALLGTVIYKNYISNKADQLNYTAIKLYGNLNPVDRNSNSLSKTELAAILKDLKDSYELKKSAITLFYIANCYYDMGDLKESEKMLIEINQKYSDNKYIIPLSYLKLYYLYRATSEDTKASEILNKLYGLESPFYKDICLFQMGKILEKDGKPKEAIAKYQELVKNYPDSPYAGQALYFINAQKTPEQKK
ncbi:MAG: tetratricopeptide repeat protein [Nitrospirae bacterium]|nr:tetratricopeptide repeat protein [Nitrospirota bacterium]